MPRTCITRFLSFSLSTLAVAGPIKAQQGSAHHYAVAGLVELENSCPYPVFLSIISPNAVRQRKDIKIDPLGAYTTALDKAGDITLNVTRTTDINEPPMQFHYITKKGYTYYDMSLAYCYNTKEGCPGKEGGYKALAGDICRVMECAANEDCRTKGQAFLAVDDYKTGRPIGYCPEALGLGFEMCALNK